MKCWKSRDSAYFSTINLVQIRKVVSSYSSKSIPFTQNSDSTFSNSFCIGLLDRRKYQTARPTLCRGSCRGPRAPRGVLLPRRDAAAVAFPLAPPGITACLLPAAGFLPEPPADPPPADPRASRRAGPRAGGPRAGDPRAGGGPRARRSPRSRRAGARPGGVPTQGLGQRKSPRARRWHINLVCLMNAVPWYAELEQQCNFRLNFICWPEPDNLTNL